jgi:hypothetical protein
MDFKGALWELMLGRSGRVPDAFGGSEILVFAVGSALMGCRYSGVCRHTSSLQNLIDYLEGGESVEDLFDAFTTESASKSKPLLRQRRHRTAYGSERVNALYPPVCRPSGGSDSLLVLFTTGLRPWLLVCRPLRGLVDWVTRGFKLSEPYTHLPPKKFSLT